MKNPVHDLAVKHSLQFDDEVDRSWAVYSFIAGYQAAYNKDLTFAIVDQIKYNLEWIESRKEIIRKGVHPMNLSSHDTYQKLRSEEAALTALQGWIEKQLEERT